MYNYPPLSQYSDAASADISQSLYLRKYPILNICKAQNLSLHTWLHLSYRSCHLSFLWPVSCYRWMWAAQIWHSCLNLLTDFSVYSSHMWLWLWIILKHDCRIGGSIFPYLCASYYILLSLTKKTSLDPSVYPHLETYPVQQARAFQTASEHGTEATWSYIYIALTVYLKRTWNKVKTGATDQVFTLIYWLQAWHPARTLANHATHRG